MRSGGWQAMIEFDPERRKKWAYRTDRTTKRAKDQSSLDDDKTQSALRFAMRLDQALKFQDEAIHEMAVYGLDGLLNRGQFPHGGFPQVWTGEQHGQLSVRRASYPESWSRTYSGHQEYWYRPTLNDDLAPDVMRTLLLAEQIYRDAKFQRSALKLADFLVLAQMPEPQPAWAQQYSFEMQPIWARKFEPPAITAGESQGVIETLLYVYSVTGERKYLEPIPRALDYLERSLLPGGKLARFYELQTNRPLYFTKDYRLTYEDSDVPTHYSFKVGSRVTRLRSQYERLSTLKRDQLSSVLPWRPKAAASPERVREIVDGLDERGAWVSEHGLRYHKRPGPVIDMRVTTENLKLLAAYLRGK
jgi:PelA/Pel-15E family pectate lyase